MPYDFSIARSEVSNADYAAFLNAVARLDDRFGLYTPLMTSHFWGGVARVRCQGRVSLRTKARIWAIARHLRQLVEAPRVTSIGSNMDSPPRDMQQSEPPKAPQRSERTIRRALESTGATRSHNARFALPTCDEWSKAAYYDPKTSKVSTYPNRQDRVRPGPAERTARDSANMMRPEGFANAFPHLVAVDSYRAAASAAGTVHQAGNALEWLEDPWGEFAAGAWRLGVHVPQNRRSNIP